MKRTNIPRPSEVTWAIKQQIKDLEGRPGITGDFIGITREIVRD